MNSKAIKCKALYPARKQNIIKNLVLFKLSDWENFKGFFSSCSYCFNIILELQDFHSFI